MGLRVVLLLVEDLVGGNEGAGRKTNICQEVCQLLPWTLHSGSAAIEDQPSMDSGRGLVWGRREAAILYWI